MKTDVITVSSTGTRMEAALNQADKMAAFKDLSPRNALHLRLLTEEMMGMMRAITGETEGQFWIEDEDGEFRLHLLTNTRMNTEKRDRLLSAATSGKNESARGLMGRLLDFFDRGADEDISAFASPLMLPGAYEHTSHTMDWEWSMMRYEQELTTRVERNDQAARDAWDELEKSVVARVADEVKVSIRGRQVEMTIVKKMA